MKTDHMIIKGKICEKKHIIIKGKICEKKHIIIKGKICKNRSYNNKRWNMW